MWGNGLVVKCCSAVWLRSSFPDISTSSGSSRGLRTASCEGRGGSGTSASGVPPEADFFKDDVAVGRGRGATTGHVSDHRNHSSIDLRLAGLDVWEADIVQYRRVEGGVKMRCSGEEPGMRRRRFYLISERYPVTISLGACQPR